MIPVLTISGRSDGFGAQYYACATGIAYARYKKYTYRHTPFKTLSHPYLTPQELGLVSNRLKYLSQIFAIKMNEFCGLRSDSIDDPQNPVDINPGTGIMEEVSKSTRPDKYFTPKLKKYLRELYFSTPKPPPCPYDVAIHVRRGDVTEHQYPHRYIPLEYYQNLITHFAKKKKGLTIGIYSDGDERELFPLQSPNATLCLGRDSTEAFHALVTAPHLVIAKSYFSFSAAILSQNIIYSSSITRKELPDTRLDPYVDELKPLRVWRNLSLDKLP